MKNESVVFIGGFGRSGSTLLEMMLNEVPGVISVGELCWIWDRGLSENQLCGCGKPFRSCVFWTEVFIDAFGSMEIEADNLKRLRRSVDRQRYIPFLLFDHLAWPGFKKSKKEYLQVLETLFESIKKVSGASIVVDSSKRASHGFLLASVDDLVSNVVHLVRDSRAVSYSWRRKRKRPEIYWKDQLMGRYNILSFLSEWNFQNSLIDKLKKRTPHGLTIKYEDLVKDPASTVQNIVETSGIDVNHSISKDDTLTFGDNHTISGNPIRFKRNLELKLDDEWHNQMSAISRSVVTIGSYPLLRRYGYLC